MKTKYLLAALFLILLVPATDYARTWTDKFGKTIEGKFVRVTGDAVVILRGNKPVTISLNLLSDKDQEYVRSQSQKTNSTDDVSRKKIENPFEEAEKESQTSKTKSPASGDKDKPSGPGGDFTERTWVDLKGNRLVAKFVNIEDEMVVLSKDGVIKKYPLDKFSASDRFYIDQQVQKLRREGNTTAIPDSAKAGGNSPANETPNVPSPSPAVIPRQQNVLSRNQEILQKMEADRQARQAQMEAARQQLEQEARLRAETQQMTNTPPPQNQSEQYTGQPPLPPSSLPRMSDIPIPQYTETHISYCSNCKKEISLNAKAGDRCPHCGVVWDFQKNEKGEIVATAPGRQYTGIIKIIVVVIVLAGAFLKDANPPGPAMSQFETEI